MTKSNIKLTFTGDWMLGGEFRSQLKSSEDSLLDTFEPLKEQFRTSDIVIINLEGPLSKGSGEKLDRTVLLDNPPEIVEYFKDLSRPVFVLGNNHILDFGEAALKRTIEILKKNDISYVGAGLTEKEANQELVFNIKDKSIAFISLTADDWYVSSLIANAEEPGCSSYHNESRILERVNELKMKVNIVVVVLHWGKEYFQYPSIFQQKLAHNLIEAGADMIIGHHPHVVQGIEIYNKSLIAYSLGNFFMSNFRYHHGRPSRQDKLTREHMILHVDIDDQLNISHQVSGGYRDKKFNIQSYAGKSKRKFERRMKSLSEILCSSEYERFWWRYKKKRQIQLELITLFNSVKFIFGLRGNELKQFGLEDLKRPLRRILKIFK